MRIALITDIHEDIVSLKKAFQQIEDIGCDMVACLGDITGFSKNYRHLETRDANACLDIIREKCEIVIAGNHDLLSVQKTPSINPGFKYPDDWYDLEYEEQLEISGEKVWFYEDELSGAALKEANLKFLKELPEYSIFDTGKVKILFTHYIYPNLTGSMRDFCMDKFDFGRHKRWMNELGCYISFTGHHHPNGAIRVSMRHRYFRYRKNISIKNGSVVILPPLVDHRIPNRFCIFDTETNKLTINRI